MEDDCHDIRIASSTENGIYSAPLKEIVLRCITHRWCGWVGIKPANWAGCSNLG